MSGSPYGYGYSRDCPPWKRDWCQVVFWSVIAIMWVYLLGAFAHGAWVWATADSEPKCEGTAAACAERNRELKCGDLPKVGCPRNQ